MILLDRVIHELVDKGDAEAPRVAEWIEILYDQALVAEGAPIADPGGFARRITSLISFSDVPPNMVNFPAFSATVPMSACVMPLS